MIVVCFQLELDGLPNFAKFQKEKVIKSLTKKKKNNNIQTYRNRSFELQRHRQVSHPDEGLKKAFKTNRT